MTQRTERFALALGLALALFLGVRPYLANLPLPPNTTDGVFWVLRGDPWRPGWSDWVFRTQHFGVGHRPVTALSYTLDHLVGGLDPRVYRATDLGLFALAGLLIYALLRALARDLSRWAGVAAVCAFAFHPSAEYVVPILARRSYLLGTVFSLGALVVFTRSLPPRRDSCGRAAAVGVGALLGLAILSNEASVVALALLPLIARRAAGSTARPWRLALRVCAAPGTLALLAILYRIGVVGGLGGYALPGPQASGALAVFGSAWHSLTPWLGAQDVRALAGSLIFAALVLPFYAWHAVVSPALPTRSPGERLPLLFVVWLLATALLYAVLGVWWHRMAFFLLAPFALLVGAVLDGSLRRQHGGKLALAGRALPQAVLLGLILFHSPALHGQSAAWREQTQRSRALIDTLRRDLSGVPGPAVVLTVLPVAAPRGLKRDGIAPLLWANATLGAPGVSLEALLFYERSEAGAAPRVEGSGASRRLRLPAGRSYFVPSRGLPGIAPPQRQLAGEVSPDHPERGFVPLRAGAQGVLALGALGSPKGVRSYLYVYDGSSGALTPLP